MKTVWYQHWSAKHNPTQRDRGWCCNKLCIFFFVIVQNRSKVCSSKSQLQNLAKWHTDGWSVSFSAQRECRLTQGYIILGTLFSFHDDSFTSPLLWTHTCLLSAGRRELAGWLFQQWYCHWGTHRVAKVIKFLNPRGALLKSNVAPSLSFSPPNGEQTVEVEEQTRMGGIEEELAGSFFQRYKSGKDMEGTKIQLPSKFTSYASWVVSGN